VENCLKALLWLDLLSAICEQEGSLNRENNLLLMDWLEKTEYQVKVIWTLQLGVRNTELSDIPVQ